MELILFLRKQVTGRRTTRLGRRRVGAGAVRAPEHVSQKTYNGEDLTLGEALFRAILSGSSVILPLFFR